MVEDTKGPHDYGTHSLVRGARDCEPEHPLVSGFLAPLQGARAARPDPEVCDLRLFSGNPSGYAGNPGVFLDNHAR